MKILHKIKRINWRKGNGEFIGFAVIGVILSSLIILIASFLQLSTSSSNLTKSATAIGRSVAICTNMDDARSQAQSIAENTLVQYNVSNVSTNVEFAPGTSQWVSGGFVVVTVGMDVKTLEPYFTSGRREKKVLVGIEGRSGNRIDIPSQYGNGGYTVTKYDTTNWSRGTMQRTVFDYWRTSGGGVFSNHIATIQGYYLIACTPKFGTVGDIVRFELSDGTIISCIVADQKNLNDARANEWGHSNGQNIIEFEVEASYFNATRTNPGTARWMPEWRGKRVVAGTNYGKFPGFS